MSTCSKKIGLTSTTLDRFGEDLTVKMSGQSNQHAAPSTTTPATASENLLASDVISADSASEEGASWVLLARILRPQGRKGEVLADLFTDFPDRFKTSSRVFLAKPDFTGSQGAAREADILGFFLPLGKNSGRIVLTIEGVSSITAAETLSGLDVLVPREERMETEEDASYISDLIGCAVHDVPATHSRATPPGPETLIGIVNDIHFPSTPDGTRRLDDVAPLLSVLSPTGSEILIPYARDFLISLDVQQRRILMTLPSGLLEVNA